MEKGNSCKTAERRAKAHSRREIDLIGLSLALPGPDIHDWAELHLVP